MSTGKMSYGTATIGDSDEKNPDPSTTRTEVGHAGVGVLGGGRAPDWRDVVCSVVWVGLLTVAFWRGTWNVFDLYVFPRSDVASAVVCFAVGTVTCTALNVAAPALHAFVTGAPGARRVSVTSPHADVTGATRARRMAVTIPYSYVFCVATVAHWRGVWKLLDTFVPLSWTWSLVSASVGFVGMALLRSSRTAVTPPMGVGIDTRDNYFVPLPRFRSTWRTPWRYFLDHAFGRAIVESLVVTAWRGIWNFYSDVIFPRDPLVSSVVNLLGAIALVVALLLAERPAGRLARHLAINGQRVVRLTFESAYILLALAAVVGYWRGWWLLLEENILPQAVLGPWLCHAIGYVALALTIASDSLTQRSVILNGETNSEVHWEIEYMSVLLGRKHAMHQQVET